MVGLWGGPYLTHVYGYGLKGRGEILFVAAVAQIVGSLRSGGRWIGCSAATRCRCCWASGLTAAALAVIAHRRHAAAAAAGRCGSCVLGFVTAYTPVMIAHGKSLFPPHLIGRGMTVLNMGTMGGVFLAQAVSGFGDRAVPGRRRGLSARCLSPGVRPAGRCSAARGLVLSRRAAIRCAPRASSDRSLATAVWLPGKIGKDPLLFVRRGSILVQRGNAIPSHSRRPPWAFPP